MRQSAEHDFIEMESTLKIRILYLEQYKAAVGWKMVRHSKGVRGERCIFFPLVAKYSLNPFIFSFPFRPILFIRSFIYSIHSFIYSLLFYPLLYFVPLLLIHFLPFFPFSAHSFSRVVFRASWIPLYLNRTMRCVCRYVYFLCICVSVCVYEYICIYMYIWK